MPVCLRLFLLTALCISSVACEQARQFLTAKPAEPSPFLGSPARLKENRDRAPFHRMWSSPNRAAHRRAVLKHELYIAPVDLRYLRPISKRLARLDAKHLMPRQEEWVAAKIQSEFVRAFVNSPRPRYRIVTWPTKDSLTLEIALIELNPTSGPGNAVKKVAGFFIGPIASLGGHFTKGNIAIEGRVRNSRTREPLFEFADNESDKMTFYSLRDFQPYGHARIAIKEWAEQFEQLSRTDPSQRIAEAEFWTLAPW